MLALSSDWYWESDASGCITLMHDGVESVPGARLNLVGLKLADLGSGQPGRARLRFEERLLQHLDFGPYEFSVHNPHQGQGPDWRWLSLSGQPKKNAFGSFVGYRGIGSDVSARRASQEKLWLLGNQDALTHMPNRERFHRALDQAVTESRRCLQPFALALVDLDDFHAVNAAHGTALGDAFLKQVAQRLQATLHHRDLIARLGGDQFGVLLSGLGEVRTLTLSLQALLQSLEAPLAVDGLPVVARASLGVSLFPSDASDAANLLRNADMALHRAKAAGGGQYALYRAELRQAAQRRSTLMQEMGDAVRARQALELFYQPVLDFARRRVLGCEALLRWQHPRLGQVSIGSYPQVFDNLAVGAQIGRQVLDMALAQLAQWRTQGVVVPKLALNVTAGDFVLGQFADRLVQGLERHQLQPDAIAIEVTEGMLLKRSAQPVLAGLRQLHGLGCEIAFDDFGTGYASLAHLTLPVDRLKIDQSFVHALDGKDGAADQHAAIIQAVVDLARALGKAVTVEGVETEAQLNHLLRMGCTQFQGDYFAKPMAARELPAFLARFQHGTAPSAPAPLLA